MSSPRNRAIAIAAVATLASGSVGADDTWRISSDTLVYTDTDNTLVVTPQLSVRRKIDEEGGMASASVVVDVISAASVDVVSQATNRFSEVRTQADLSISKSFNKIVPAVSYRRSQEPDYVSNGGHVGVAFPVRSDDTTVSLGFGYTADTVSRSGTPESVFSDHLATYSGDVSLTQVLGPRLLIRGAYTLTGQRGYMEKPYRHVPLFTDAGLAAAEMAGVKLDIDTFSDFALPGRPPEEVPDERLRHALAFRGMYYLVDWRTALKLDYQLYFDSWGVLSNMAEPSAETYVAKDWMVRVFARFYQQGAADFWQRTYTVTDAGGLPKWRTADRGLTAYRTLAGGARVQWSPGGWLVYLSASAYQTSFSDYLYLDSRLALISQLGGRWQW